MPVRAGGCGAGRCGRRMRAGAGGRCGPEVAGGTVTDAMRCGAAGAGSVGPEMTPDVVIAVAGLFVALGGFVQSGVGLGLGLVAAPVVTLLDPALMPGAMLVAGASLPLLILARESSHTDWRGGGPGRAGPGGPPAGGRPAVGP